MSKLFDALGWMSPLIIRAKTQLQKRWTLQEGWDVPLPHEIQIAWAEYKLDMTNVDEIMIPRCNILFNATCINLVGFSDASVKNYGLPVCIQQPVASNNLPDHIQKSCGTHKAT